MAYPLVVNGLLARAAPALTQAAAKSPLLVPTLVSRLRLAGETLAPASKLTDVLSWLNNNKAKTAIFLVSLAGLGVDIKKYFDGPDLTPGEKELVEAASGVVDDLIDRAASASEALLSEPIDNPGTSSFVALAQEVLPLMVSLFGSPARAIEGHRKLQAFMEMPHRQVVWAFENVRLDR